VLERAPQNRKPQIENSSPQISNYVFPQFPTLNLDNPTHYTLPLHVIHIMEDIIETVPPV